MPERQFVLHLNFLELGLEERCIYTGFFTHIVQAMADWAKEDPVASSGLQVE